jgi:hypothetical protein
MRHENYHKQTVGKDMEIGGHGLFEGTIPAIPWGK